MPRTFSILAPSLVAVLTLGLAASARADVAEPEPATEPPPAPESPKTQAEPPTDTKTETKTDTKTDTKTSSCSMIEGEGTRNLFGFAALVLLISGASLRRRSA
jgi:hypothetical protein